MGISNSCRLALTVSCSALALAAAANAARAADYIQGDSLLISTTTYQDVGAVANLVAGTSLLPGANAGETSTAVSNGALNTVWNNASGRPVVRRHLGDRALGPQRQNRRGPGLDNSGSEHRLDQLQLEVRARPQPDQNLDRIHRHIHGLRWRRRRQSRRLQLRHHRLQGHNQPGHVVLRAGRQSDLRVQSRRWWRSTPTAATRPRKPSPTAATTAALRCLGPNGLYYTVGNSNNGSGTPIPTDDDHGPRGRDAGRPRTPR